MAMYIYIYIEMYVYICILYGMLLLAVFPMGSCPECSSGRAGPGSNEAHLGPLWAPVVLCGTAWGLTWALMGRALVGTPRPLLARWALMGRALVPPLGRCGPEPCGRP